MFVALLTALVLSAPPAPPPPDPYPTFDGWQRVVTYAAYDIDLPAVNAATGKVIPGVYFHCHVPVRWHGKPNRWGRMTCVLRKR